MHREMLVKQISTLKYLTRQGLAVRGHDDLEGNLFQLLKLRSQDCPQLNTWIKKRNDFSPQVLNEQIALMGLNLLGGMLADMSRAHWFSLIADEATDISHNEQVAVCIRWVDDDFVIHEDPVELIHVPKTDADTLISALEDCLVRLCLPLSQCRGQAYDGASAMSGHLNGVAAQIERVAPAAVFVPLFCTLHKLVPADCGCRQWVTNVF